MKTKSLILGVIILLPSCSPRITKNVTLIDIIRQYNNSLGIKDKTCYYYNIMLEINKNDTVAIIEGQPFEHYWNFLPPPPPPDSPEEIKGKKEEICFVGPMRLCEDTITIYINDKISVEYVKQLIGNIEFKSDSIYIQNHQCKYYYEPQTMRFNLKGN